jgi:outer membrane protein with beta-barrel domain
MLSCALAAALIVSLGAAANAQTLVVRGAPPNSTVEFVLNNSPMGSATVNAEGDAVIPSKAGVTKADMDAFIYVDACDTLRRVFIEERGTLPPAPESGCNRTQISGSSFLVKRISTVVITVSGALPAVLLRQGSYDLHKQERTWTPTSFGLVLFGGGGLTRFSQTSALSCGNATECAGDDVGFGFTAGADFWLSPYIAAEVSYTKPADSTADGSGTGFRFNSAIDAHILNIAGKVGIPVKRARIYGKGGATYHRATWETNQTIDPVERMTDSGTVTVPGGTQNYRLDTGGWGWSFGGGVEIWLVRSFALYAEGGRFAIKGSARDGADGSLDEGVMYVVAGGRVRLWR